MGARNFVSHTSASETVDGAKGLLLLTLFGNLHNHNHLVNVLIVRSMLI
jgi:hypothetical protein